MRRGFVFTFPVTTLFHPSHSQGCEKNNEIQDEYHAFLDQAGINTQNWFLAVLLPLLAGGFGLYAVITRNVSFGLGGAKHRTNWIPLLPYEAMLLGLGLLAGAILLPLACYGEDNGFVRRHRAHIAVLGIMIPLLTFFGVVFLFIVRQLR